MKKKGISAIVATVLLILIVVAGITIVYVGILPMFNQITEFSSGDVELGIVLDGYTVYDDSTGFVFVQVQRGSDDLKLAGLEIIFEVEGNSIVYEINESEVPGSNQKATYAFKLVDTPSSVRVVPVIMIDGKRVMGTVSSKVVIPVRGFNIDNFPGREIEATGRSPKGSVKYYYDGDLDDYGNSSNFSYFKTSPTDEHFVSVGGDCDDYDENVNPGIAEVCGSEKDDDCDGDIDGLDSDCDGVGVFFSGSGTSGSPYIIYNCYQLQNMSYSWGYVSMRYYNLGQDIDCSMTNPGDDDFDNSGIWQDREGFNPVGDTWNGFWGIFDGKGYSVNELFINRPEEDYVGLFGYLTASVSINNLGMKDSQIFGGDYVGGIVGFSSGVINNSYNTGTVEGSNYVGGITGQLDYYATLQNSYNTGTVEGSNYVGGIVGKSRVSKIDSTYNTGTVEGSNYVGEITGSQDLYYEVAASYYLFPNCLNCNAFGFSGTEGQMKNELTFTNIGWDFTNTWAIEEGQSYPYLINNKQVPLPGTA